MNYTLYKVNQRPKLSCYIEMCKNKISKLKSCDIFSYLKNLEKCVDLFEKNNVPEKFYNLLSIRESLRNTTIKKSEVLDLNMEIVEDEIFCFQFKEIKKDDKNYSILIERLNNYEQFDDFIRIKLKISFKEFETKYSEISGFRYHLFGINQKKSYYQPKIDSLEYMIRNAI